MANTAKTVLLSVLGTFLVLAGIGSMMRQAPPRSDAAPIFATRSGTYGSRPTGVAQAPPRVAYREYACESTRCREYSDGRVAVQIPLMADNDLNIDWIAAGGTPGRWYSRDRYQQIADRMLAAAARRLRRTEEETWRSILRPTPDPYY